MATFKIGDRVKRNPADFQRYPDHYALTRRGIIVAHSPDGWMVAWEDDDSHARVLPYDSTELLHA